MKKNTILITIGIGGLALATYFILKGRKGGGVPNGGDDDDDNVFPPIGGLDYATMADKIFKAMDGYQTNEQSIENEILKLRNKADWEALVAAYGVRTIDSGWGNFFQDDFTGTLPQALKSELNEAEMVDLKANLRKIGVSL